MKGKLFLYHLKGTQRNKPVPLKDTSYLRLRLTEIKNIPFSSSKILKIIPQMIIIVNTVFLTLTYLLKNESPFQETHLYCFLNLCCQSILFTGEEISDCVKNSSKPSHKRYEE